MEILFSGFLFFDAIVTVSLWFSRNCLIGHHVPYNQNLISLIHGSKKNIMYNYAIVSVTIFKP